MNKFLKFLLILTTPVLSQEISEELPDYSPKTPTTADLGRYGEVQVNESTGIITPTIPVLTYNAGDFEIPINLYYSGNGVRVNQDPTWAGINWNVNPGGVITREVKDRPDELTHRNKRLYLSSSNLESLSGVRELIPNTCYFNSQTQWFTTLKQLNHTDTDSEVDIFNYNFMGYSGSFYLDINNNPHIIKKDKDVSITFLNDPNNIIGIEIPSNKSEIIIRTPNGDTYFFGGVLASESSRTWINNGSGSTANIPYTQNAFYLYKIVLYNGGEINFEYDNYGSISQSYKIGISETASVSYPLGIQPCNRKEKQYFGQLQNGVVLKKITNSFNTNQVVFNSSFYGNHNRLIKLNTIELNNGINQLRKVKLDYLNINNETGINNPFLNESKIFLKEVKFYDKTNTFVNSYKLEYNKPELFPSKNSFAQDELGFYNGENTNTTLLPKTNFTLLNENCHFELANREANLYNSMIGALEKIIYPTGGYSSFEYELTYKGEVDNVTNNHYVTAYFRDVNRNNTSSSHVIENGLNSYSSLYFPNEDNLLVLNENKTIFFNLNIYAQYCFTHQSNVTVYALKSTPQGFVVEDSFSKLLTNSECDIQNYLGYDSLNLSPGTYIFKLAVNLKNTDISNNHSVIANLQLFLPNGKRSVFYPGLRIKKIINENINSTISSDIKRFYYYSFLNPGVENFQFNPNYVTITTIPDQNTINGQLIPIYNLSANSVRNTYNMNEHLFNYVTISYGGDNFELGGIQKEFMKYSDYQPDIYNIGGCYGSYPEEVLGEPSTVINYVNVGTNDSYQNTVLKNETILNTRQNKVQKTTYEYDSFVSNVQSNIHLYRYGSNSNSTLLGPVIYFLYDTKSYNYKLTSTKTSEYSGINYITELNKIINYTYSQDKVSLPNTVTTTNSLGEIKKSNIYYPSDVALLNNLSSEDIANINNLQNRHNLSQVIKTESLINNVVLETKQISFNTQGYPKTISSSKGNGENDLEERVIIHSYYYGKPSLVSLKDGTRVKYEYNSNLQVVLKIENYAIVGELNPNDPEGLAITNNNSNSPTNTPCQFQDMYPDSMVTRYEYDTVTNNLIKITDPKCNTTTYHYDNFNRLQYVKDKDGNILSENEYHYKN